MTRMDKLLMLVITIIFLVIATGMNIFLHGREEEKFAVIKVSGVTVETVDLTEANLSRTIRVRGPLGTCIIQVNKGAIRMVSSPCPRKICVKQGWINRINQTIVCVPNEVSISIEGTGRLDAIIQ